MSERSSGTRRIWLVLGVSIVLVAAGFGSSLAAEPGRKDSRLGGLWSKEERFYLLRTASHNTVVGQSIRILLQAPFASECEARLFAMDDRGRVIGGSTDGRLGPVVLTHRLEIAESGTAMSMAVIRCRARPSRDDALALETAQLTSYRLPGIAPDTTPSLESDPEESLVIIRAIGDERCLQVGPRVPGLPDGCVPPLDVLGGDLILDLPDGSLWDGVF